LCVIAFATSYLAESVFSWVTYWLSKVRTRFDVVKRGDLCLALTALQRDIQNLASVCETQGIQLNIMGNIKRIFLLV
jgi:hypothetical protein